MRRVLSSIVLVSATTAVSQILMKKGLSQMGGITFSDAIQIPTLLLKMLLNPLMVAGVLMAACTAFVWLTVISKTDLSYAFPISSGVFYVLLFLLSWLVFREQISWLRLAGTAVICLGIAMTAIS